MNKDVAQREKEKAIIYGLGNCWEQYAERLHDDYEIIYCSDRDCKKSANCPGIEFVMPSDISSKEYDVLILCNFAFGMREDLMLQYGLKPDKMIYCLELYGKVKTIPEEKLAKNVNKLTVIIPTYNRRLRLERTLSLLKLQTNPNFNVIILDDNSNYSVDEIVDKQGAEFAARIKVERNIGNLGLAGNTATAFAKVEEGWVWTLADDDVPSIYAVELIHQEIEESDEVGIILFSILGIGKYMTESHVEFKDLNEMLLFYQNIMENEKSSLVGGDFIFFSNKIFNMKYVKKYLKEIFMYLYTTVPQNMPILFGLDNRDFKVRISNKKVVSYSPPDGDHWSWLDNGLGMTVLADLPLRITQNIKNILFRLCMFDYHDVINAAFNEDTSAYEKLEKMYFRLYRYFLSEEEKQEYLIELQKLKTE
ncbi:glycosyltransferase family 2 protein [Acetatifactor aquisgranensis]|uniref:glycosyltransferase family 2 protein n=1 Tax=Acetatifactor aquisgranensis TaxID=2941233 RepID=UPI00203B8BB3|nr:glycosyltransferase family 2 protein [Acetatifactor aquisgranensis]